MGLGENTHGKEDVSRVIIVLNIYGNYSAFVKFKFELKLSYVNKTRTNFYVEFSSVETTGTSHLN